MGDESENPVRPIYDAVHAGDVDVVRRGLLAHPELQACSPGVFPSWVALAAHCGNLEMAKMLIELGVDVHAGDEVTGETALNSAIAFAPIKLTKFLLSKEADPNAGRTLFGAINREDEDEGLELVKLLIEHGADKNRVFHVYDEENLPAYTPLTFAERQGKEKIAVFLRSIGAVAPPAAPKKPPANREEEIVAHFEKQFGPARPGALREVVPTGVPIAIHAIPPSESRKQLTLFTTGMSEQAMTVPEGQGDYRYAELLIHLPGDWPLTKKSLGDPKYNWPIRWLQETARYPHDNETWLGGPFTIISKDPPKRIAPNAHFTAMLLAAKGDMRGADGRLIQLYTLFPLYPEERELELNKGLPALMRALDRSNISDVLDLNRPNVATAK